MFKLKLILLSGVLFLLNSCMPVISEYPITKKGNTNIDPRLIGTWTLESEFGHYTIMIEPIDDRTVSGMYYKTDRNTGALISVNAGTAFVSEINGQKYLNVKVLHGNDEQKDSYVFFKYFFRDENTVEFAWLSLLEFPIIPLDKPGALLKAIKADQNSFDKSFMGPETALRDTSRASDIFTQVYQMNDEYPMEENLNYYLYVVSNTQDAEKLYDVVQYFRSILPMQYRLSARFFRYKSYDNTEITLIENCGDRMDTIGFGNDGYYPHWSKERLAEKLNWDNYELAILREKLFDIGCESVDNMDGYIRLGFQPGTEGQFCIDYFNKPIPTESQDQYNDECRFKLVSDTTVIEFIASDTRKGNCMPVLQADNGVTEEPAMDSVFYSEDIVAEDDTYIYEDSAANINFDTLVHDFGRMRQGEIVSFDFRFTNTGNMDLFIYEAIASCGCTVTQFTTEAVPPGGEGFVRVTFDTAGKEGHITKGINLITNLRDGDDPCLMIRAHVIPQ